MHISSTENALEFAYFHAVHKSNQSKDEAAAQHGEY